MQLVIVSGTESGRVVPLSDGQSVSVGRSKLVDIQVADETVSRLHCLIEVDDGRVLITDHESRTGTFVNGKLVTKHELSPGDVLKIGQTRFRLELEEGSEVSESLSTQDVPPTFDGRIHALANPEFMDAEHTAHKPDVVPPRHEGNATEVASSKSPVQRLEELVGTTIRRYRVDKSIAKASTGMVFQATDVVSGQVVALKILWPEFSKDVSQMKRFIRSMKTMQPIQHPNIVRIKNAGKIGPYCWIAMDFVDGESLTQVIQRIGTAGMLDWQTSYRAAVHVGRALEYAYEHQIVHRNLTPRNILLRKKDKVALVGDLMLAKALEATDSEWNTEPGRLVGEVAFMAPERTRSQVTPDCRSDIYGLGATLYALLTGRPPFEDSSPVKLVAKIRADEPLKPTHFQLAIPGLFQDAVLKMLAKRPEDRYQTPAALLKDLQRIGNYLSVEVPS